MYAPSSPFPVQAVTMSALIVLLIVMLIALSGWLLLSLDRLQKRLAALQAHLHAEQPLPIAAAPGQARIAIEILNPFELAARESRLAPALARLAPRLIERIVYQKAAVMIAAQMAEHGVKAEVKTHVG